MYYTNVLLNFQSPATPICPTNCGYQILNGLYMPIMHLNYSLHDYLVKPVNHNLQVNNTNIEQEDDDYSRDEFDDELTTSIRLKKDLLTIHLFKTNNIFYYAYLNIVLKLEARQNFLF